MTLGELSADAVVRRLRTDGLGLQIGPFSFRLISPIDSVAEGLITLYSDYPLVSDDGFSDYTVRISRGRGWRRWGRRQAIFEFDGRAVFTPLPEQQAFTLLEWSMNWCVAMHAHQYLTLHAAVIERDGGAAIMPAPPGSGKSTLCAGLVNRGWRLLSDELALISPVDASVSPFGRPISLKNQSIDLIRAFAPDAVFSRVVEDTAKGRVALLKIAQRHLNLISQRAQPRWIIFPKYVAGAEPRLRRRSKADSMLELGRNSFNYMVLGRLGFEVLGRVVDACECFDFEYSRLDDAVEVFGKLAGRAAK